MIVKEKSLKPMGLSKKSSLWPYCGSVTPADWTPAARMFGQREFSGEFFVDVDTESGSFVNVHVAILDSRTSGEVLSGFIVKTNRLLDPEVRNRQIEMRISSVTYRRDISRSVPCRADIKPFT